MSRITTRRGRFLAGFLVVVSADVALASPRISDLSWLAGCWAREDAEPGSVEVWLEPAGGVMLGMSRTVRGGKTVEHEFLEIREVEPGTLGYVAHPSGQASATFKLLRSGDREVVFENLAHDFPQRILYRRTGDELVARVEGERNGQIRGFDFPMTRCQP